MPKKKQNKLEQNKKHKISEFVKKKPKAHQKVKRDNQFVFTGFYDRLKSIDVKQTHSSLNELNFRMDHITTDESGAAMGEEDLQNSVFIQLLKSEKFNNRTPEFTKIFREIEGLCFSFPLLIMNKEKVVTKLLKYLDKPDLSVIHCTVVELCIALIKDLRQEIYDLFLHEMLPKTIEVIDGRNLQLLDKIFQMLSISFKYLVKPIKENIKAVYAVYFELLVHKNHFVRKFTAQSFSYVVRKLPFEQPLINMLFEPVKDQVAEDKVHGLSDLLFEVLSGQGDDFYSKARQMLQELLRYKGVLIESEVAARKVIRFLYLKLVNHIDVSKQMPLFEELNSALISILSGDDQFQKQLGLTMVFQIMNDAVKLKFGKRFCQEAVILFTQNLNSLLSKNINECLQLSEETRIMIAETLGMLYYFKHHHVVKIFQASSLDFQTAKSAFTQGVYKLQLDQTGSILRAYFKLLFQKADTIEAKSEDIDFGQVLHIKKASQVVVFAEDAHRIKAKMLVKSLAKQTFKVLAAAGQNDEKMAYIALLVSLVQATGKAYLFELTSAMKKNLKQLVSAHDGIILYGLSKFLSYCKDVQELKSIINAKVEVQKSARPQLQLDQVIKTNQILSRYHNLDQKQISQTIALTLDIENHGFVETLPGAISLVSSNYADGITIQDALNPEDASNMLALSLALKIPLKKASMSASTDLVTKLAQNLSKNNRKLRILTLKLFEHAFEPLNFVEYDPEQHGHLLDLDSATKNYIGSCPLISYLLKMEQSAIGIEYEKQKANCLRSVKILVQTGLIPDLYLQAVYYFLVGCLWIKFLPLQEPTIDVLGALFTLRKDEFLNRHINLFEQYSHISQIACDSDDLMHILLSNVGCSKIPESEDLFTKLHLNDTRGNFDINSIKDFHYLLAKSMFPVVDLIFTSQTLRSSLYQCFQSFYHTEFLYLHRFKQADDDTKDLKHLMIQANLVDSDRFKTYRKTCYSKLCAQVELFSKSTALNKLNADQSSALISSLTQLLNTSDTHLQQVALSCLIKSSKRQDFDNPTLKLPKYQKLLEGLTDDTKFKDMIPIIVFGSQEGPTESLQAIEDQEETQKESKRNIKGNIPRLEKADRLEVLPFIIKLLFSKLMKKKGAINNKNIFTRRNIVYQFLSGLDPVDEFQMFFSELLEPLGLGFVLEIDDIEVKHESVIRRKLAQVSLNALQNFLNSLEVIFKQLGNLLTLNKKYLSKLAKVLVITISLAKEFIGHLKADNEEPTENEGTIYVFVVRQSKAVARKGLQIVKQLYKKFSANQGFVIELSNIFNRALLQDQLTSLHDRYISERSMLVEILALSWSQHPYCMQNYLTYPEVFPSLLRMLSAPKIDKSVFQLLFQLIKNLVVASLYNGDEQQQKNLSMIVRQTGEDEEMSESDQQQVFDQELARTILEKNVSAIGEHLFNFWTNHQDQLRQALLSGSKRQKQQPTSQKNFKEQITMQMTAKDLVFVLSELASYLGAKQIEIVKSFLVMLVQLINNRAILQGSSTGSSGKQNRADELLMFGSQAITSLLEISCKYSDVDISLLDKIMQMLLVIPTKTVRLKLCQGLQKALSNSSLISGKVLGLAVDLNQIKHGLADIALDFDKLFVAIQEISWLEEFSPLEVNLLIYCAMHLLRCEEYSVRDYTLHALSKLVPKLELAVFVLCEKQLINYVRNTSDEMILKTILQALKLTTEHANKNREKFGETLSFQLSGLLSTDGSKEDFFSSIVSLQIQTRQKALRKLRTVQIPIGAFKTCILPLVDFLIFDVKVNKLKDRNSVRYTKDQTAQLLEDALNVYQSYAKRLKWGDLFRLVKMLLFKIEKATRKGTELAAVKSDLEMEKVLTKCLCKVLEGFAQSEVVQIPDAVDLIAQKAQDKAPNEFSAYLADIIAKAKPVVPDKTDDHDMESQESGSESAKDDNDEFDIIKATKQRIEGHNSGTTLEIQKKLALKILPQLQRHLTEIKTKVATNEVTPIRSYVAICIAKIIRKLPILQFTNQLNKLVNLIVIKGLRAKDLQTREKARKALLKVVGEVSPQFLTLIVQEMKTNLDRGYQLHVFLYTVHYLLNHLTQNATSGTAADHTVTLGLQTGQITSELIQITSDLLTREMFGDLYEERLLTDTKKKHIKESKAHKAFPIFEVFAEYIDFKHSFLDLIAPVMKILEENPNINKITQCEELLSKISNSLLKNKSLNGEQLLVFLYSIINRGVKLSQRTKINDEKQQRDYGEKPDAQFIKKSESQMKQDSHSIQMQWVKANQHVSQKKTQEVCGRVLASFGLKCLKKALLAKGLILTGDEHEQRTKTTILVKQELADKLDPFVPLLLDAFKTFYNPIIVTTLSIMIHVIHLGLPSFKLLLKKFIGNILKLFAKVSNTDTEFLNSLFKCVTELIRTYSVYSDLSEMQIKTLVQIIKANVQNFQSQANVFQCLRAIIYRKFLCADLYDLMETIQEMMVSTVSHNTREVCAGIFVSFMIEYPLEQKRLEQHINHMLKNLSYFDPEGRLQLLDTLQTLIDKFPQKLLDSFTELFFFTLFLRMVNDDEPKCRAKIVQVMSKIVQKTALSRQLIETVFKMQLKAEDDVKADFMLQGKLQMVQIFAQAGKLLKEDVSRTVQFTSQLIAEHAANTRRIMEFKMKEREAESENGLMTNPKAAEFLKAIDLGDSSEEEEPEEQTEARWNQVYIALLCIENLCPSVDGQYLIASLKSKEGLLLDITQLAWHHENFWVRLSTQRILGHIFSGLKVTKHSVASTFGLETSTEIQKFLYSMLGVFKFHYMSDELALQLVKNLVFVTTEALQNDPDPEDISKIFGKASYIGRMTLGTQTESTTAKLLAIIQYFSAMVALLLAEQNMQILEASVEPILKLVYRTYTDEQVSSEVRDLSTQIVDTLSENLDKDLYIRQFNKVQQDIGRARSERKLKDKLMVGTVEGQMIKAKRRMKKSLKQKEKHRQAIEKRKFLR